VGKLKGFAWVTLHTPSFRGKYVGLSYTIVDCFRIIDSYDIVSFSNSVEWGIMKHKKIPSYLGDSLGYRRDILPYLGLSGVIISPVSPYP